MGGFATHNFNRGTTKGTEMKALALPALLASTTVAGAFSLAPPDPPRPPALHYVAYSCQYDVQVDMRDPDMGVRIVVGYDDRSFPLSVSVQHFPASGIVVYREDQYVMNLYNSNYFGWHGYLRRSPNITMWGSLEEHNGRPHYYEKLMDAKARPEFISDATCSQESNPIVGTR
jgi:hypothetical protein